jgi:hypothetical protein
METVNLKLATLSGPSGDVVGKVACPVKTSYCVNAHSLTNMTFANGDGNFVQIPVMFTKIGGAVFVMSDTVALFTTGQSGLIQSIFPVPTSFIPAVTQYAPTMIQINGTYSMGVVRIGTDGIISIGASLNYDSLSYFTAGESCGFVLNTTYYAVLSY